MQKVHLNIAVSDLDKSVAFYRTLLGSQPAKALNDYALFITDEPAMELALDLDSRTIVDSSMHFGVVVDSTQAVEAAATRLSEGGFPTNVEIDETCCYARQTKVWTSDPDGRRWETYVVHEDTDERSDARSCCEDTQPEEGSLRDT